MFILFFSKIMKIKMLALKVSTIMHVTGAHIYSITITVRLLYWKNYF